MRNYIASSLLDTPASPLALIAYAKVEEGTGQAPNADDKIEEVEEDPFAGFEVSEEIIGREQDKKYGWEKFPAPSPVLDAEGKPTGRIKYATRRIPLDGVKVDTIRGSIKKYMDKVVAKLGKDHKPELRTTSEKDDDGKVIAVFVQRIK